nr:hypothetical protein [uncultured bacterium]
MVGYFVYKNDPDTRSWPKNGLWLEYVALAGLSDEKWNLLSYLTPLLAEAFSRHFPDQTISIPATKITYLPDS